MYVCIYIYIYIYIYISAQKLMRCRSPLLCSIVSWLIRSGSLYCIRASFTVLVGCFHCMLCEESNKRHGIVLAGRNVHAIAALAGVFHCISTCIFLYW